MHKIIKALMSFDKAYQFARESGLSRGEALRIANNSESKTAFNKFGHLRLPTTATIIDVGANRGQFLEMALKRYTSAKVFCLEPLPDAFADLRKNFADDKRVTLLNCAIGSMDGVARLEVNAHDQASSLLPIRSEGELRFTHRDLSPEGYFDVQVRKLDSVAKELDIIKVHLIKIDVQGYELEVLIGAEYLLNRTDHLIIEVNFYPQYEGSATFWQVHTLLEEKGFVLKELGDFQRANSRVILQGDALYSKLRTR